MCIIVYHHDVKLATDLEEFKERTGMMRLVWVTIPRQANCSVNHYNLSRNMLEHMED